MAEGERKGLVWAIKRTLLTLSADELFRIAKSVGSVPGMDESCINPPRQMRRVILNTFAVTCLVSLYWN